jgi:hypothetical protein
MLKYFYWATLILLGCFSYVQASTVDNIDIEASVVILPRTSAGDIDTEELLRRYPRASIDQTFRELQNQADGTVNEHPLRTAMKQSFAMWSALKDEFYNWWEENNCEKYGVKRGITLLSLDKRVDEDCGKQYAQIHGIFFLEDREYFSQHRRQLDLNDYLNSLYNRTTAIKRRIKAREFEAKPEIQQPSPPEGSQATE